MSDRRYESLRAKYRELARTHKETVADLQTALSTLDQAVDERDDFERRLAEDPEDLRATADRLSKELRQEKHRRVFDQLAPELGARPDALDDLWGHAAGELDSDDVDREALSSRVKEALEKRPFLRREGSAEAPGKPAQPSKPGQPSKPQLPEGPGEGRGGRSGGGTQSVAEIVRQRFAETGRSDPSRIS